MNTEQNDRLFTSMFGSELKELEEMVEVGGKIYKLQGTETLVVKFNYEDLKADASSGYHEERGDALSLFDDLNSLPESKGCTECGEPMTKRKAGAYFIDDNGSLRCDEHKKEGDEFLMFLSCVEDK